MKVDVSDLSPVKKCFSIEVPSEDVAKETRRVLQDYARKARIPGFRPGKAPLSVIQARFAKEVDEDARDRLVARAYQEAAAEHGLSPLADPVLDEVEYEPGQSLRFKTTFEVMPKVELQAYKGIEVMRASVSVADADVDRALEELQQSQVKLVAEEGREATTGDVLVADLDATAPGSEPFQRERILIEVGANDHLPAFTEALLGARSGASLEFSVDYPEGHPATHWAGKSVSHKVQVHEVKRKDVPDLDDELAKDLGEFENLAALRAQVRKDLEVRAKGESDRDLRQAVLDKVLLANPILLPDVLVEREVRQRLEDVARNMIMQGVDLEKVDIDWADVRKRQEDTARKSVHARMILDAVAGAEDLAVDDKEIEERIRTDAERMGRSAAEVKKHLGKGDGFEALKNQLLREKSLDLLTSVANIQKGKEE